MGQELTVYETVSGVVKLSPQIIRQYLVSGDPASVSDQEIMMFLQLCKYQKLNPFLREVYLIKYGKDKPATMVTGKETFLKRAVYNPKYQGHEVGIDMDTNGKLQSAWAKVYVAGYVVPIYCEVDFEEYCQYSYDSQTRTKKPTRMWAEKPKTMLKKVALVQAFREAFPDDFGGLYSQEEINSIDMGALTSQPVVVSEIPEPQKKQKAEPVEKEQAQKHIVTVEEVGNMLLGLAGGNKEDAANLLETITSFTNKEGKVVCGRKTLKGISDAQLKVVYGKAKDLKAERERQAEEMVSNPIPQQWQDAPENLLRQAVINLGWVDKHYMQIAASPEDEAALMAEVHKLFEKTL